MIYSMFIILACAIGWLIESNLNSSELHISVKLVDTSVTSARTDSFLLQDTAITFTDQHILKLREYDWYASFHEDIAAYTTVVIDGTREVDLYVFEGQSPTDAMKAFCNRLQVACTDDEHVSSFLLQQIQSATETKQVRLQSLEAILNKKIRTSKVVKIVISAGTQSVDEEWIRTTAVEFNLLSTPLALKMPNVVDNLLAEHVFEHIPIEHLFTAALNCFTILKPGGRIRVAVPDVWAAKVANSDYYRKEYLDGHNIQFNYQSLAALFNAVGFQTILLEYFHIDGVTATANEWDWREGKVERSKMFDSRGQQSIILDAIKPTSSNAAVCNGECLTHLALKSLAVGDLQSSFTMFQKAVFLDTSERNTQWMYGNFLDNFNLYLDSREQKVLFDVVAPVNHTVYEVNTDIKFEIKVSLNQNISDAEVHGWKICSYLDMHEGDHFTMSHCALSTIYSSLACGSYTIVSQLYDSDFQLRTDRAIR